MSKYDFDQLFEEFDNFKNINPFKQTFNPGFMRKYTNFKSIEDFFSKSKFKINSNKDLEVLNEKEDKELDEYVKENTNFENWNEMAESAEEYLENSPEDFLDDLKK